MQLKAAGLFKYVWPFSRHQALEGYEKSYPLLKKFYEKTIMKKVFLYKELCEKMNNSCR